MTLPVENFAAMTGLSCAQTERLFARYPRLGTSTEPMVRERVEALKEGLELRQSQLIRLISKCPTIVFYKAETLRKNGDAIADILQMGKKDIAQVVLLHPRLLTMGSRTLRQRMRAYPSLLRLREEVFLAMVRRSPHVLTRRAKPLALHRKELSEALGLPLGDVGELYARQPGLFGVSVEQIADKVTKGAAALGIGREAFMRAARRTRRYFTVWQSIWRRPRKQARGRSGSRSRSLSGWC